MRLIILLTALYAVSANATGDRHGSVHHNNSSSSSTTTHIKASNRVENVVHQKASSSAMVEAGAATSSSTTTVGDTTAYGGKATGGDVGDVSLTNKSERSAPGVGLVVPQSTMECSKGIGLGGSNTDGSVLMGWSWLQRDCWAMKQFETLAAMNLPIPAARAFCSRKRHWFPFESEDKCREQVAQSLIAIEMDRQEVAAAKKYLPSTSPLQRWMRSSSLNVSE